MNIHVYLFLTIHDCLDSLVYNVIFSFLNYVKKIDDNKQQSYSSTSDGTLSIITDEQVLKKRTKRIPKEKSKS